MVREITFSDGCECIEKYTRHTPELNNFIDFAITNGKCLDCGKPVVIKVTDRSAPEDLQATAEQYNKDSATLGSWKPMTPRAS